MEIFYIETKLKNLKSAVRTLVFKGGNDKFKYMRSLLDVKHLNQDIIVYRSTDLVIRIVAKKDIGLKHVIYYNTDGYDEFVNVLKGKAFKETIIKPEITFYYELPLRRYDKKIVVCHDKNSTKEAVIRCEPQIKTTDFDLLRMKLFDTYKIYVSNGHRTVELKNKNEYSTYKYVYVNNDKDLKNKINTQNFCFDEYGFIE